jgi:hypothetical protein
MVAVFSKPVGEVGQGDGSVREFGMPFLFPFERKEAVVVQLN